PRDMVGDRPPLLGREQVGVPLVRQDREARLLVEQLAPEAVDHAYRPVPHSPDDGMVLAAALQQFANEDALVDEVEREVAGPQPAAGVLDVPRVHDPAVEAAVP